MMTANIFAMPSSTLLIILSIVFGASNALPWAGPQPTVAYKGVEWSPRPTTLPANPAELFKRDSVDVAVCGWIGGISSEAAVCPQGSSCIHDSAHGYVGCCATSGPCTAGVYTSCVDFHNTAWNSSPVWQNDGVYTCPGQSECYRNAYPGGYSQWACGSPSDATTIETSFIGQPTDLKLQIVFTAVTFAPLSTTATTTSSTFSTSTTTSDSTSSSTSSSPTAAPTAGTTNKSTVSGGVIAAAVIVPLFVIALLLAAYFFWWRKRRSAPKYIERPSSFTGVFRSGNTPDSNPGHFPEMQLAPDPPSVSEQQPFSPDDYVSPMTEGANISSPGNAAVISPPGAYGSIQERLNASEINPYAMPEQSQFARPAGAVSEIEHFSGAYMAAIGSLSPMTPPQARMGYMQSNQPVHPGPPKGNSWLSALKGVDGTPPPPEPQYDTTPGTGAYIPANINRLRDDSIDAFAALDKESGGISKRKQSTEPFPLYEAKGILSENVREEGWVPSGLRPNKKAPNSPNRYQLVDQAPDDGALVLHEPGQLRGKNGR